MGVCKGERRTRWPQVCEPQKKKGFTRRGAGAAAQVGGSPYLSQVATAQVIAASSAGEGFTSSAPTYGSAPSDAQTQVIAPITVTAEPVAVQQFDPSGTFQQPDGRWLMSQR